MTVALSNGLFRGLLLLLLVLLVDVDVIECVDDDLNVLALPVSSERSKVGVWWASGLFRLVSGDGVSDITVCLAEVT